MPILVPLAAAAGDDDDDDDDDGDDMLDGIILSLGHYVTFTKQYIEC